VEEEGGSQKCMGPGTWCSNLQKRLEVEGFVSMCCVCLSPSGKVCPSGEILANNIILLYWAFVSQCSLPS
jgi:hypothetical protein